MKAKKIVIVLYWFWERYEGIENIYKTRKKSTKSHADSCYYAIFLERFHSEATAGGVLPKKSVLKIFANSTPVLASLLTEAATGGIL